MSFTAGVFTPQYNWLNEANAGNPIDPTKFTAEEADIATGLSTCILKDGTQTVTADIPWGGKKITGLGTATAGGDALSQTAGDARYAIIFNKAKASATTKTSDATPANDPELTGITLSAGHTYAIKLFLAVYITGAGAPGITFNVAYTGTFTAGQGYGTVNGTALTAGALAINGTVGISGLQNSSSTPSIIVADCTLVATTGGTLSCQWSQNLSSSTSTTVAPGSFLQAIQVG